MALEWEHVGSLKGPQGDPGEAGAASTVPGPAGADGKTLRAGSGVPSSGLGINGDFYIDTTAWTIYGPKVSGAWGSATSIVGPAGSSSDATTSSKGIVQLAGDLAGTAAAPTVPGKVGTSRTITAGTGLTGGGDLSADRTLTVAYGTGSGTAAQGNDARLSDTRTPADGTVTDAKVASGAAIALSKLATDPLARANHTGTQAATTITGLAAVATSGAKADVGLGSADNTSDTAKPVSTAQQAALDGKVPTSRTVTASTGLTGGGDLTADRSLAVSYGTASGTAAEGSDTRITGAAQKASNLSDLASAATARTNLGLAAVAASGAKADVGLGNVDNTADTAKPVSTAQQTALDGKAALTHYHGGIGPADMALSSWTYDPIMTFSTSQPTAGVIYLMLLRLPSAVTVTSLLAGVSVAGATLSNCYLGLYRYSDGVRLGVTADQSTSFQATGPRTGTLTTPYAAAAGLYRVAFVLNGTTMPTMFRAGNTGMANAGLSTAATSRFATFGTSQTSLPSTIDPTTMALATPMWWAATA